MDQASTVTLADEAPPPEVTEPEAISAEPSEGGEAPFALTEIVTALVIITGALFKQFLEEPSFRNFRALLSISVITVFIVAYFFDDLNSAESDSVQFVISILTGFGLLASRGRPSKRVVSLGLSALALRHLMSIIFQLGLISFIITIAIVRSQTVCDHR